VFDAPSDLGASVKLSTSLASRMNATATRAHTASSVARPAFRRRGCGTMNEFWTTRPRVR
jgi:hypothetical protein